MKHVIPAYATARQVGLDRCATDPKVDGYTVFTYEHPRTRLTLYGVELKLFDGTKQEIYHA